MREEWGVCTVHGECGKWGVWGCGHCFNLSFKFCHKILIINCRQHIWFTGTTFHGYEDLGEGPGDKPAKHVMMMMVTALNMSFKVPVGYFLLPDSFSSEKRAELLRNCIYHLNATGAVVTNLVMDNCPVNYATFRRLYHFFCTVFCSKIYQKLYTSLPSNNLNVNIFFIKWQNYKKFYNLFKNLVKFIHILALYWPMDLHAL